MMWLSIGRIIYLIPVLIGGSAIVFTLIHLAPGDPIDFLMGVYASPEARTALRAKYGLTVEAALSQVLPLVAHRRRATLVAS